MGFSDNQEIFSQQNFDTPPVFDESIKSTNFSIDWNLNKILEIVCKCAIFCTTTQEKLRFVNAVTTLNTLSTPYWILDTNYQQKIMNLDKHFQETILKCEPSQQNWITGHTGNGENLLDIAVSIAQQKFQLLMVQLSKANKDLNKEEEC